jgi:hypothetical protein
MQQSTILISFSSKKEIKAIKRVLVTFLHFRKQRWQMATLLPLHCKRRVFASDVGQILMSLSLAIYNIC